MSIVTVHAQFFRRCCVLLQQHGFLVAAETDLLPRQEQLQRCHVALGLRQVADSAPDFHGGVNGLASGFIRVTGGTIVLLVKNARVLDGASSRGRGQ